MIGYLRGRLAGKQPPSLLVDVNGVGYEVEAPMSTIFGLPEIGAEVQLHTHFVVRQDQQTLYGFATEAERSLFREVTKVSGVGAKMGLTILSGISVDGFASCVQAEDKAALTRLPGIGRKTAERLIVEMRDRLSGDAGVSLTGVSLAPAAADAPRAEAFHALVSLGYKPAEANRMLDGVKSAEGSTEDILRQVLRSAAT
ncbi:MAG: Holliday junction branch migration protein RuvA [Gammaproteobacteria bacterium]